MRKIQPIDARALLREELKTTSQGAFAEKVGAYQPTISLMANGHRRVSDRVLRHLGLKRISVVVRRPRKRHGKA